MQHPELGTCGEGTPGYSFFTFPSCSPFLLLYALSRSCPPPFLSDTSFLKHKLYITVFSSRQCAGLRLPPRKPPCAHEQCASHQLALCLAGPVFGDSLKTGGPGGFLDTAWPLLPPPCRTKVLRRPRALLTCCMRRQDPLRGRWGAEDYPGKEESPGSRPGRDKTPPCRIASPLDSRLVPRQPQPRVHPEPAPQALDRRRQGERLGQGPVLLP